MRLLLLLLLLRSFQPRVTSLASQAVADGEGREGGKGMDGVWRTSHHPNSTQAAVAAGHECVRRRSLSSSTSATNLC